MATTSTWSVDADGDWGDAADWSLHALPNSSDAIVINTTRGPTVDEKALIQALRGRRIFAAGLPWSTSLRHGAFHAARSTPC